MDLCQKLIDEKPNIKAKLGPLDEAFKALVEEFSITLKDEDQNKRNNLREALENFNQMLVRIQQRN